MENIIFQVVVASISTNHRWRGKVQQEEVGWARTQEPKVPFRLQTHPRAIDDDDDDDASCSSCSTSSSDNDDFHNHSDLKKPYGGIRASYLPNDRLAVWRNSGSAAGNASLHSSRLLTYGIKILEFAIKLDTKAKSFIL